MNAASSEHCAACGCPARPRYAQIQRFARLAALRADKIFEPVDADFAVAASSLPSPQRTACIVLAVLLAWAVVAVMVRLSLAPVSATRAGAWLLDALMAVVAVLALATSFIVYRSARHAWSQREPRPEKRTGCAGYSRGH